MPKRILDGEAIWSSTKLAKCSLEARKLFPWLLPLADARGCFEITSIRSIYGRVSAILDDLTEEKLHSVFEEYIRFGLLFTWADGSHVYAFWVGSDKPGRLPPKSQIGPKEKTSSPSIPVDLLTAYVNRTDSLGTAYPAGYAVTTCALALAVALAPASALASAYALASETPNATERKRRAPSPSITGIESLSITAQQDKTFADAFPWVDRPAEYRRMAAWISANPERAPKNHSRFAHNWIAKINPPKLNGAAQREHGNYSAIIAAREEENEPEHI